MTTQEKSKEFKTSIGGQALIEGIMMRGPSKSAIVVRTKDGLVEKTEELKSPKDKYPILGFVFIRGVVNFASSISAGMRAIMFSADKMPEEEQEKPSKLDVWIEKKTGNRKSGKGNHYYCGSVGYSAIGRAIHAVANVPGRFCISFCGKRDT